MSEKILLLATGLLLLGAVLIPVPRRGRIALWIVLGLVIAGTWAGAALGYFAPLP